MKINILLITFFSIVLISCDGGLDPSQVKVKTGYIKGTINYINGANNWPPSDSVKDIRVVAFKNYPPNGILEEVISGNAFYTLISLPFFVDSSNFEIEIPEPPLNVKYLVVAQQFGGLVDWRAIGVLYGISATNPTEFTVNQGETKYVKINVDFNNLPPQPFK